MESGITVSLVNPIGACTLTIRDTNGGPALARLEFGSAPVSSSGPGSRRNEIPHSHRQLARRVHERLRAYLDGQGLDQTGIPLIVEGLPFSVRVWERLMEIPFGQTTTYGAIAAELGKPGAARAIGQACHCNQLPIFIPCHRVLDARGSLHGYAGGLERKAALLACEGALLAC